MKPKGKLLAVLATAALLVPAVALAKPGHGHGRGHGHGKAKGAGQNHPVSYVFKGMYEGDGSVAVKHGNSFVRKGGFVGQDVQFDLSGARLTVADTSGDGLVDSSDVAVDDAVVVKARLPKHEPGDQPFAARQLVDQTHPADAD